MIPIDRRSAGARMSPVILLAAFAALLLVDPAPLQAKDEFPAHFYFNRGQSPAAKRVRSLEGRPAPELKIKDWAGDPLDLETLEGKVVVVDFWATWCGPCMRALPKNRTLARKYRDRDVVFIGIHDARRGHERMPKVVRDMKLDYPIGVDDGGVSARAWRVGFWPTYGVIDRKGIVRAVGITPNSVEPVIEQVLAHDEFEGGGAEGAGEAAKSRGAAADQDDDGIPNRWLEGNRGRRARLAQMLDPDAPPPIVADEWMHTTPLDLESLKGKVVVLDFWATWCGPCLRSIAKNNRLNREYGDQGLVIIGICHPRGSDKMRQVVASRSIEYPVCVDTDGDLIARYGVDGFPDYYIIDRSGRLRIADCDNNAVESAIKVLLAEK